jgi:hypothetical protein
MFSPTDPFNGGAQSGFTSPTYGHGEDVAPSANGKQVAIDTLGGTQVGVTAHSVSSPFTISVFKPVAPKGLGAVNPVTGQLGSVPRNVYKVITRKGVTPLAGQAPVVMLVETIIHVPAGSDTADAANVKAAISAHIGALNDQSSGLGTTLLTGVI